jgi:hypothetical protein
MNRLLDWLLDRGPVDWGSWAAVLILMALGALIFYVLHTL